MDGSSLALIRWSHFCPHFVSLDAGKGLGGLLNSLAGYPVQKAAPCGSSLRRKDAAVGKGNRFVERAGAIPCQASGRDRPPGGPLRAVFVGLFVGLLRSAVWKMLLFQLVNGIPLIQPGEI
jgi:hypothetical protein